MLTNSLATPAQLYSPNRPPTHTPRTSTTAHDCHRRHTPPFSPAHPVPARAPPHSHRSVCFSSPRANQRRVWSGAAQAVAGERQARERAAGRHAGRRHGRRRATLATEKRRGRGNQTAEELHERLRRDTVTDKQARADFHRTLVHRNPTLTFAMVFAGLNAGRGYVMPRHFFGGGGEGWAAPCNTSRRSCLLCTALRARSPRLAPFRHLANQQVTPPDRRSACTQTRTQYIQPFVLQKTRNQPTDPSPPYDASDLL